MNWFAKKMFDKRKKQKNSAAGSFCKFLTTRVCGFIKKIFRGAEFFELFLIHKLRLRSINCGTVLIEFAVCMPILIILLFYINDLVKLKRLHSQTEFVGQQMANIIQNISQKKTDKRIFPDDLRYALCLANLSMFPGTTMYTQDTNYPGYATWVQMYRVVGAGSGKAKCTSRTELSAWNGNKPPKSVWCICTSGDHGGSKVRYSASAVTPSQIYPTLKIGDSTTDEKIIIDVCLLTDSTIRPAGKSTDKQILGFHLVTPSFRLYNNDQKFHFYFHSAVIFTPKSGLFSETLPS